MTPTASRVRRSESDCCVAPAVVLTLGSPGRFCFSLLFSSLLFTRPPQAEHDRKKDRCKGEIAVCENQLSAGLDAKQKLQGKATQAATKHDAEAVKLAPLQKEADDAAAEFDAIYAQASAYTTSNRPDWVRAAATRAARLLVCT